jgi:hypothetical protein
MVLVRQLRAWIALPGRFYLYGSLAILLIAAGVISAQVTDRSGFANDELRRDVIERWGAPVEQVAPSVRYVESGSVFNALHPLALARQRIELDADMNYRKRGLVYFSGFEFDFRAQYTIANPEAHAIDVVFVFPVEIADRSMLSNLRFTVNGEPAPLPLDETATRLTWTGRLESAARAELAIAFEGQGLDSFRYHLDPSLPVQDFALAIAIRGGEGYDYGEGVFPATQVAEEAGVTRLVWSFPSVKAGFTTGVILPSERSFDAILHRMIRRAWAPFLLFMACLVAVAAHRRKTLGRWETYLAAAMYAFFYVLLPYLAAYVHFYAAFALAAISVGALLIRFLCTLLGAACAPVLVGLWIALLVCPCLAVVLEPHTGLLYTTLILAGLVVLGALVPRPEFRRVMAAVLPEEKFHVA